MKFQLKASMKGHGNELLTNSGANFNQFCIKRTLAHAANST